MTLVIKDHFSTLYDARTGKLAYGDLVFFYGVPVVVGAVSLVAGWNVSGIDNLLAALSIMTGLLFNLLVLLFDAAARVKAPPTGANDDAELAGHRYLLIQELQANVTYTLGVGIFCAIVLGGFSLANVDSAKRPWSTIIILILLHFSLLLGLLLKRLRSVFLSEFPRRI